MECHRRLLEDRLYGADLLINNPMHSLLCLLVIVFAPFAIISVYMSACLRVSLCLSAYVSVYFFLSLLQQFYIAPLQGSLLFLCLSVSVSVSVFVSRFLSLSLCIHMYAYLYLEFRSLGTVLFR